MDNKKYQDEFEQFLQDEVKQHRMYPSDHVWTNIRTDLHGYRAWPALTFISLFVITALTISTILNTQHQQVHLQPLSTPNVQLLQQEHMAANEAATEKSRRFFNSLAREGTAIVEASATDNMALALNHDHMETGEIVMPVKNKSNQVQSAPSATTIAFNYLLPLPGTSIRNVSVSLDEQPVQAYMASGAEEESPVTTQHVAQTKDDGSNNDPAADAFLQHFTHIGEQNKKINRKPSKFGIQFYITPSTSYRKLSDEKVKEVIQPAMNAMPSGPAPLTQPGNINEVVRHKASVGLELGFGVLYNITNRLKLKTGLQLNIREYQIETFRSASYDRATISLINFRGVENIVRLSPYNNNVGYREATLNNKVYQLSVPLGLQWDLLHAKHWSINTEASVQPTLNLNKDVYLLSTDYKHYAEGNDFVRRWNVNTSVGVNISYTSGKTSWQIGPQVRYQHLSTYSNKYPIREYLMDYGLRIGFTKALQ